MVNLQVYRVDNIIADNPQAIKDALTQVTNTVPKPKANALSGIDLSNHAGVVIIDYIPDEATANSSSTNSLTSDNKSQNDPSKDRRDESHSADEENDGFLQVMTKKGKKAEKLKAAQAAAAAAAAAEKLKAAQEAANAKAAFNAGKTRISLSNNRKDSNNNVFAAKGAKSQHSLKSSQKSADSDAAKLSSSKSDKASHSLVNPSSVPGAVSASTTALTISPSALSNDPAVSAGKSNNGSIMTNIQTWNNEMASPETAASNSPGSLSKQGTHFFLVHMRLIFKCKIPKN